MEKGSSHLVSSYKDFLDRGIKALDIGKYYPALSAFNLAKKVMEEMTRKGAKIDDKEARNLDKLIAKAKKKQGDEEKKKGGAPKQSVLSRLRIQKPAPGGRAAPPQKKLSLFIFGLDRAGKTTLVDYLQQEKYFDHTPTLGINISRIALGRIALEFNDLGGQEAFRSSWMDYWKNPDVLVFVVDAADTSRLVEARDALWSILNQPNANGKPLLVLSNKVDLPDARRLDAIKAGLGLENVSGRVFTIFEISIKQNYHCDMIITFLAGLVMKDEEMSDYVNDEVSRLAKNLEEIYTAYVEEAKVLEKSGESRKAYERVYKAKLVQEELLEHGYSSAAKKRQKCQEWMDRLMP
ncbi:MAG TPA: ADP-ribosylation factor-like protein [Candidatus Lokiarchaeia archaeon]|nr:ADP-ribosylation factor-like protein [Candidatus Lokiarchaeia archaeon]